MASAINSSSSCSQLNSYSASSISSSSSSDAISSKAKSQEALNQSLISHAESGNVKSVELLLAQKADPKAKGLDHRTPLHRAAMNGHNVVMKLLLDAGANKYASVPGGFAESSMTAMNYAISFKYFDAVQVLAEAGYDVNFRTPFGDRPLEDACNSGSDEIVKYLLSKGAKPSLSPYAIFNATLNPKSLTLMLEHRANIDVRKPENLWSHFSGSQPLHYAASTSCKESIHILLKAGANKTTVDANGKTPLDHLQQRIKSLNESGQIIPQERLSKYEEMVKLLS